MCRLIKFICLVLITMPIATAVAGHDPILLRAQASIYPKIVLLDKDVDSKTKDDSIVITIVHQQNAQETATQMKKLIESEYNSNLGKKHLVIETQSFDVFNHEMPATAYILIGGSADDHHKVTHFASIHNRVAFSYDYKDIENNILVSLFVKEKTYIYLNKAALSDYDVRFLPLFYKIVKVLE